MNLKQKCFIFVVSTNRGYIKSLQEMNTLTISTLKNTNGVLLIGKELNSRIEVVCQNEYVASNNINEAMAKAGLYGKNKTISFNYGFIENRVERQSFGKYVAIYDVLR